MKQSLLVVWGFLSINAFAGTVGNTCHTGDVSVPCVNNAWDIDIDLLYLKAGYTGEFSTLINTREAPNTYTKNYLNPNWGFGFKLGGSYHFNSGNDLQINWYHYKKSTDDKFTFLSNPTPDSFTITPKWDAVNLELGQHVDFGDRKNIRFHGGLEYARIKSTFSLTGLTPGGLPGSEYIDMEYNGVGPRIGADLSYDWVNGFAIFANGATALTIGDSKFSQNETFGTPNHTSGSRLTVVPMVDLKVGGQYARNFAGGNLSLDVGYMLVNYFNVLHNDERGSETNFSLNGPFVGMEWVGNI